MANYAVVKNGVVENVVVWDGETEFFVDGATLVVAPSGSTVSTFSKLIRSPVFL